MRGSVGQPELHHTHTAKSVLVSTSIKQATRIKQVCIH